MTEFSFPAPVDDEEAPIQFHFEDIRFPLSDPALLQRWIEKVIEKEQCQLYALNFIFCTDSYLHQINVQYLGHDTLTDIITFPYQEPPSIEGDIFISLERVRENAHEFDVTVEAELRRVIIHGVLHLCGYPDKAPDEKRLMTKKEDAALELLNNL